MRFTLPPGFFRFVCSASSGTAAVTLYSFAYSRCAHCDSLSRLASFASSAAHQAGLPLSRTTLSLNLSALTALRFASSATHAPFTLNAVLPRSAHETTPRSAQRAPAFHYTRHQQSRPVTCASLYVRAQWLARHASVPSGCDYDSSNQ